MVANGELTYQEILSQPEVWGDTLKLIQSRADELCSFFLSNRYDTVLFTGCGSTYYLSLAAAAALQSLAGVPARGLPSSELWLYQDSSFVTSQRTLLVAISRSGETSETLHACETFRQKVQGEILTLTCYPSAALTASGDINLIFAAAHEESIAQTRAFSSLYIASMALAALWSGRQDLFTDLARLPGIARRLMDSHGPLARRMGEDRRFDRFYFLGSGSRYGLACELSLKMKEMSLSHSEPFHFLEFRHGPKSMVTASTLLIGLVSQSNYGQEHAVLEEMKAMGGAVLEIGEEGEGVAFRSGLDEAIRNPLYLPVGQLLAFARSTAKGLNPDAPKNLEAVVRLP
jgi:glucosamine--fructose-6-phosphate aminotransferase (isomerizing)